THRTEEGKEKLFYVIGKKITNNLYLELHIDLQRLVQSFEISGLRPELLISSGPLAFFYWKRAQDWPVVFVSPNVYEIFGYSAEEFMSGKVKYAELIHPEDLPRVAQEVEYHTKNRSKSWTHQDYRIIRKDGRIVWLLDHTVPVLDDEGEIIGYYGYVMDITEKHEKEELFYLLAENNPNGVVLYDYQEDRVLYVNTPLLELLGYEREEILGKGSFSFVCEEDKEKVLSAIRKRKEGSKEPLSYTVSLCAKGGRVRYFKLISIPLLYKGKEVSLITLVDITEEEKLKRKLEYTASHDYLTRALNRGGFFPTFEHLIAQAERYDVSLSLLMLDIDNFKMLNDTYGHMVGDEVLKRVAKVIRKNIRKSDLFARYGGEEFVIALPMTAEPFYVAEKIRKSIEEEPMLKEYGLTVSIGATVYRKGDTPDSMIARADQALYKAKSGGKNRVVFL
ncbi:MAG: GGDEF domain-containing protein, partial [Aquificota bacterium]